MQLTKAVDAPSHLRCFFFSFCGGSSQRWLSSFFPISCTNSTKWGAVLLPACIFRCGGNPRDIYLSAACELLFRRTHRRHLDSSTRIRTYPAEVARAINRVYWNRTGAVTRGAQGTWVAQTELARADCPWTMPRRERRELPNWSPGDCPCVSWLKWLARAPAVTQTFATDTTGFSSADGQAGYCRIRRRPARKYQDHLQFSRSPDVYLIRDRASR